MTIDDAKQIGRYSARRVLPAALIIALLLLITILRGELSAIGYIVFMAAPGLLALYYLVRPLGSYFGKLIVFHKLDSVIFSYIFCICCILIVCFFEGIIVYLVSAMKGRHGVNLFNDLIGDLVGPAYLCFRLGAMPTILIAFFLARSIKKQAYEIQVKLKSIVVLLVVVIALSLGLTWLETRYNIQGSKPEVMINLPREFSGHFRIIYNIKNGEKNRHNGAKQYSPREDKRIILTEFNKTDSSAPYTQVLREIKKGEEDKDLSQQIELVSESSKKIFTVINFKEKQCKFLIDTYFVGPGIEKFKQSNRDSRFLNGTLSQICESNRLLR